MADTRDQRLSENIDMYSIERDIELYMYIATFIFTLQLIQSSCVMHIIYNIFYTPIWQLFPLYPGMHVQLYALSPL